MKKIIAVAVVLMLSTHVSVAQNWSQNKWGMTGGRISELEKIKLIEVLQMDEETTLKFFSRRNLHRLDQKKIMNKRDSLLKQLDKRIVDGDNKIDYKKEIYQILDLEKELSNEREKFFKSLDDILSYEQIAKLLVFEKKFRSEIRKQLIKHGKRGWKHRPNMD
ncbi:hypothetical protein MNBD_IGNAVI01-637 [hydrothermal vent metagenome]|uniref:Periplasmic heavy metal sensor n=1 Tax=hydrothermal vent metagenome TaxID=652676 RepID=A0A3B1CEP9_9ZZZZ